MASQAPRRLLPQLLAGPAGGTSPLAMLSSRLMGVQSTSSGASTQIPAGNAFLGFSSISHKDEEEKQQPCMHSGLLSATLAQPSQSLPSLMPARSSPGLAFSPLVQHRYLSSLVTPRVPLGLGNIRPTGRTPGLAAPGTLLPARTYMTEGQLLGHAFLLATDIMFWSGLIGAVVFRRNLIVMLLATEIVMLACNLNFLYGSAYLNDMTGVIMSITITTIAACETAIGLALCVTYFHLRSATDVEALNFLK